MMDRSRADRILADWDRVSREARRPTLPPRMVVTTTLPESTIVTIATFVVVIAVGVWLGLPRGEFSPASPGTTASASPASGHVTVNLESPPVAVQCEGLPVPTQEECAAYGMQALAAAPPVGTVVAVEIVIGTTDGQCQRVHVTFRDDSDRAIGTASLRCR